MPLAVVTPTFSDATAIHQLYLRVATDPAGLIRRPTEIPLAFVEAFLVKSLQNGLALIGLQEGKIVGEIHAYTPDLEAFSHLLTDLTIVIHPDYQGMGLGRELFREFLHQVQASYPHILRVELYVRETNTRNVRFYESLGFLNEGRQDRKILNAMGQLETPLHMAWFNPNYRIR
jgi:putative acetyltransferase